MLHTSALGRFFRSLAESQNYLASSFDPLRRLFLCYWNNFYDHVIVPDSLTLFHFTVIYMNYLFNRDYINLPFVIKSVNHNMRICVHQTIWRQDLRRECFIQSHLKLMHQRKVLLIKRKMELLSDTQKIHLLSAIMLFNSIFEKYMWTVNSTSTESNRATHYW